CPAACANLPTMAGPYPPQYGAGPIGPPPPQPGPPHPYPENPVAPPMYPGMLPPPIPYPKRRRWRGILAALLAIGLVLAAVVATVFVVRSSDREAPPERLTRASAQTAIQDYLDALQRGDVEEIARHTLCGLF